MSLKMLKNKKSVDEIILEQDNKKKKLNLAVLYRRMANNNYELMKSNYKLALSHEKLAEIYEKDLHS